MIAEHHSFGLRAAEGDREIRLPRFSKSSKDGDITRGNVDGIFGPKTTAAVKYFQRKNNLAIDGIVGKQTFAALGMSSNAGNSSYSNDINLLARMIAAEGRGETYLGQVAIGAVIINRVQHSSFPNTISGFISAGRLPP